jgi:hypothetical protein
MFTTKDTQNTQLEQNTGPTEGQNSFSEAFTNFRVNFLNGLQELAERFQPPTRDELYATDSDIPDVSDMISGFDTGPAEGETITGSQGMMYDNGMTGAGDEIITGSQGMTYDNGMTGEDTLAEQTAQSVPRYSVSADVTIAPDMTNGFGFGPAEGEIITGSQGMTYDNGTTDEYIVAEQTEQPSISSGATMDDPVAASIATNSQRSYPAATGLVGSDRREIVELVNSIFEKAGQVSRCSVHSPNTELANGIRGMQRILGVDDNGLVGPETLEAAARYLQAAESPSISSGATLDDPTAAQGADLSADDARRKFITDSYGSGPITAHEQGNERAALADLMSAVFEKAGQSSYFNQDMNDEVIEGGISGVQRILEVPVTGIADPETFKAAAKYLYDIDLGGGSSSPATATATATATGIGTDTGTTTEVDAMAVDVGLSPDEQRIADYMVRQHPDNPWTKASGQCSTYVFKGALEPAGVPLFKPENLAHDWGNTMPLSKLRELIDNETIKSGDVIAISKYGDLKDMTNHDIETQLPHYMMLVKGQEGWLVYDNVSDKNGIPLDEAIGLYNGNGERPYLNLHYGTGTKLAEALK